VVLAAMPIFRAKIAAFAQAVKGLADFDQIWTNGPLATITALDPGTVIPDSTGLAGANALVREEMLSSMTSVEAMEVTYNTAALRAAYMKIAGLPNI
jgi:hypothetical protein